MDAQETQDLALISAVEQFKNLYDKTRPEYKDKLNQFNSWNAVARAVGVPAEDCQRRLGVLRTKYAKVKREKLNTPSGSAAVYKRDWPLFNQMQFLDGFVKIRKTFGNIINSPACDEQQAGPSSQSCSAELNEEFLDEEFLCQLDSAEHVVEEPTRKRQEEFEIFSPAEKRCRMGSESGTSTPTQRAGSVPPSLEKSLESTCSVFNQFVNSRSISENCKVDDSDYNLCLSLYGQLKKIKNKNKKKYMRRQILALMSEMESDDEQ